MTTRTTREYMGLRPWEALITMVNDEHALSLSPETTELVSVEIIDTHQIEVMLAVSRSQDDRQQLPPLTEHVFRYTRVDIGLFFRAKDRPIEVTEPPHTTQALVAALTARTGVAFDIDDVIHVPLTETTPPYTLKAHPRSLRWTGSIDFTWPT